MNLEGNKSTKTLFKKHTFIENDEGVKIKQPAIEELEIKGILLPLKEEFYISMYGAEIKNMYKFLIKPSYSVTTGDYFYIEDIETEVYTKPTKWNKYQTIILKVI